MLASFPDPPQWREEHLPTMYYGGPCNNTTTMLLQWYFTDLRMPPQLEYSVHQPSHVQGGRSSLQEHNAERNMDRYQSRYYKSMDKVDRILCTPFHQDTLYLKTLKRALLTTEVAIIQVHSVPPTLDKHTTLWAHTALYNTLSPCRQALSWSFNVLIGVSGFRTRGVKLQPLSNFRGGGGKYVWKMGIMYC